MFYVASCSMLLPPVRRATRPPDRFLSRSGLGHPTRARLPRTPELQPPSSRLFCPLPEYVSGIRALKASAATLETRFHVASRALDMASPLDCPTTSLRSPGLGAVEGDLPSRQALAGAGGV